MIRKIQTEDRPCLKEMLESVEQFNPQEVEVAMELIDISLLKIGQQDYFVYVYEEDGKVLGYHCTGQRPLTDGVFDLYWIVVSPQAQAKGIGKKLLDHAEQIVAGAHGRWLLAETSSRDLYINTRNFYLAKGYKIVAQIDDFYSRGDSLIIFGKYFQQI